MKGFTGKGLPTHLIFLKEGLERRCQSNPSYSLRAYSRDLGISVSQLSRVLGGKQGLSESSAKKISSKLGLGRNEAEIFCTSVLSADARSKRKRQQAADRLIALAPHAKVRSLEVEHFKVISDWYHFALLELIGSRGFSENPEWIAKRLGISRYEAQSALERLESLEYIKRSPRGLRKSLGKIFTVAENLPSEAIRKFTKQILERAQSSIDGQNYQERTFGTVTLSLDPAVLPEIFHKMSELRREFNTFVESLALRPKYKKTEVYCFAMQFFRLSQNQEKV